MNDLMIDLETMGKTNNAVICSIGIAQFHIYTGEIGKTMKVNVDISSCLEYGLKVDGSTIEFWLNQSKEAQQAILKDKTHICEALVMVQSFVNNTKPIRIWGNSARFDLGILENAFFAYKLHRPWHHRDERCLRTISSLDPMTKKNMPFEGERHDALADALHQIKYLVDTIKKLKLTLV